MGKKYEKLVISKKVGKTHPAVVITNPILNLNVFSRHGTGRPPFRAGAFAEQVEKIKQCMGSINASIYQPYVHTEYIKIHGITWDPWQTWMEAH